MASGIMALPMPGKMEAGFLIKPLMVAARILGRADVIDFAGRLGGRPGRGPGGYLDRDDRFLRTRTCT